MSVNSDISVISGCSAISSISCTSSILQMNQQTLKPGTYKEYSIDKILTDIGKCEETMCQIAHINLINEVLEHVASENSTISSPVLLKKLNEILLAYRIDKYSTLPSSYKQDDEKLSIIGIMDVNKSELNQEEKRLIKSAVENELLKRMDSFIAKYEECNGNLIEAMGTNESLAKQELSKINDSVLPHWKDKLDEMCHEYYRDLIICADLLVEWQRLKHEDVEELNYKQAQTKLIKVQIAELQGRILKLQCAFKMFQETPVTLKAFKMLDECVEDKLTDVQAEIKKKTILLKEYEDLKGTEYDEILKRYTDLCATIEKDERLLSNL